MISKRKLVINTYDTLLDGHMTMTEFSLSTPAAVEQFRSVSGMSGTLDYSEAPAGRPTYGTRKLQAAFECSRGSLEDREAWFNGMVAAVHGRRCRILPPDDPEHYLMGRVQVSRDFNRPTYGRLHLTATCDPWRYARADNLVTVDAHPLTELPLYGTQITILDELTTCTAPGYSAGSDAVAPTLHTGGGAVGTRGVFRIALAANTTYLFAGRMTGMGYFRLSATADEPTEANWCITTGSEGYVYAWVYRLQAAGIVNVSWLLAIQAERATVLHNGAAETPVTLRRTGGGLLYYGMGGQIYAPANLNDLVLPAGEVPIFVAQSPVFSGTTVETATASIRWTRRDL